MNEQELDAAQTAEITEYVDIEAPPPGPTAHFIFGTNQALPAFMTAERYHHGLAPLIIVTGGINRHNGIIEGREFRKALVEHGVPEAVIRCEDQSANTWQNVEFAMPHIREALESGLPITAVCKWYHRRAVHVLRTLVPDVDSFYCITFEPSYAGSPVTRTNWPANPDGERRVLREYQEVPRRIADGSFKDAHIIGGAWR